VVAGASDDRPAVIEPTDTACVGSRAPHAWLDVDGRRVSTLDLFGDRFVLLVGARGEAWYDAALAVTRALDVPLGAIVIDGRDGRVTSDGWLESYGIGAEGAVLVRPDGHIAWRSHGTAADAEATLEQVVARVLGLVSTDRRAAVALLASDNRRCA
jgi:hypothetical protein